MNANEATINALRSIINDCKHYREGGHRSDFNVGDWTVTITEAEGFIAEVEAGTADWGSVLHFIADWREGFGRWVYEHVG